jgi:endonuclease/exonuclease/phosphatase family metal-dependent hydrolase
LIVVHVRLAVAIAMLGALLATDDIGRRARIGRPASAEVAEVAMVVEPAAPSGTRRLSVLSYNVNGLPWTSPARRYGEIGRILAHRRADGTAPDFVVLQEGFFGPIAELGRAAGYRYVASGAEAAVGASSGLYVLSDHPIVHQERMTFDACRWTDCLARKGVLAISARISGLPAPVTVITTHMQAWREYDRTRLQQVDEMAGFLDRLRLDPRMTVLAGDFNFRAKYDSYRHFLERTHLRDAGRACLDDRDGCRADGADATELWEGAIDRQFTAPSLRPVAIDWRFRDQVAGRRLSDHWGYEVQYEVRWP